MLIAPSSVSQTVDAIQSAVFDEREISARERAQTVWRNLLAGGLDRQEERLRRGVGLLRAARNEGQWRSFPFWYTTLALSEMDFPEATKELAYARDALARAVARRNPKTVYARRRQELARRVLDRL